MTVDDLRDEINKGYPILGGEDAIISRCYKIMSEHIKELEEECLESNGLVDILEDRIRSHNTANLEVITQNAKIKSLELDLAIMERDCSQWRELAYKSMT